MRQHKYCMHSIKKIGACRKRKKKKACQQVTSAPRDLLLQGTAAFIICGSRGAARPPACPARPARGGCGGGSGRGSLRLPPLRCWVRAGGPAPAPCWLWGDPARRGGAGEKVMHAGKALAPGTGNRGPGFRGRERRRAGPKVSPATERCSGEGRGWGGGQGRCESLKLKQGPAAWGSCVCLRSRLLIGIMWGSGRGGDSCDRRDASRRSAQPRTAASAEREAPGTEGAGEALPSPHHCADIPAAS